MKTNNATKVLELGAGHSRDTTFFASNGMGVEALDYSVDAAPYALISLTRDVM